MKKNEYQTNDKNKKKEGNNQKRSNQESLFQEKDHL
eukprot:CAMPEP_0117423568 /NCGR_PEP_ID=MMETSP0758-20121206/4152_1 /TAXON_ID=63605 /ORGANISM="Percolomonas cosmopolitus, Strain AE-1 (ATCC 50343)" /LENGTH=35 /DNA_ID= /DNA_START= /DNA_END= /DNA_ORIENTATION=